MAGAILRTAALSVLLIAALALCSCRSGRAADLRADAPPKIDRKTEKKENKVSGALSPDGAKHPGTILNEDKVDGRQWTDKADAVPQTIAWVHDGKKWVAVVRIEITGTPDRRRITKFAADGEMLESTVMRPPPPRRPAPEPTPMPVPTPTPDK